MTAISLITWIGYDTHSELMARITNGVFIVLFFNTGFLITLANANLSDVSTWLGSILDGTHYDYSPNWYSKVGYLLVQTMILNAFYPPIFEVLAIIQVWFFQALDSGKWGFLCCKNSKRERMENTSQKQIFSFIQIYSGPEYIVHFKFSNILNITYVTMMYGVGLPLLFPIAIFSYAIFWMTERYMLAYVYQLPPAMDDMMTKNAMRLFSYTPILFLLNSYWMLSNRQMFANEVNQIERKEHEMSSSHNLSTVFEINQATPLLSWCLIIIILIALRNSFFEIMRRWGFTISSKEIVVDEDLPNFYTAIKLRDAEWLTKENEYLAEKYKFSFVD